MDAILYEWGNALLRWLHIVAGMAWIGSSFFFMHLDATLRPDPTLPGGKGGSAWQVHGGGFYEMRKYLVAPARMPDHLTWHKWQSYATWLSGFFLLGWLYYAQAELYLVDPAVLPLSAPLAAGIGIASLIGGWFIYDWLCKAPFLKDDRLLALIGLGFIALAAFLYAQVFSGRGALVHTGALMATFMSGNVFRIIIPNQKIVIADLIAGRAPDPALGKQAKQRSVHNNYLTLPVVLLMVSNHYPLTQTSSVLPLFVTLITIAGALVRHFFNGWHADHAKAPWWCWAAAALAMAGAIALTAIAAPGRHAEVEGRRLAAVTSRADLAASAEEVIAIRCAMCHARAPLWPGMSVAPKAVLLETPGDIDRQAQAIRIHAVLSHAMPPNNLTLISEEERARLAGWIADRAKTAHSRRGESVR